MKKLKLRTLTVFYHADHWKTDGFTVALMEGDVESIAEKLEDAYGQFKSASPDEQSEFLNGPIYGQLRYAKNLADRVAQGEALNSRERTELLVYGFSNVLILERVGLLVSDDNNGMSYVHG